MILGQPHLTHLRDTFEKIHPHANRRAPDQPQTESIIEDIGEVIESHRRCQYPLVDFWLHEIPF
jgi:hypothetical protein